MLIRHRLILVLLGVDYLCFIHERVLKDSDDRFGSCFFDRLRFSYVKAVSSDLPRCLISCLEAEGDSSVISICVGKRERVLQIEVAFWNRVWKDNVFDFLIFGGGVE